MSGSKVTLVTRASRGADRGIATGFDELGYTVYVTGCTTVPGVSGRRLDNVAATVH